MYFEEFELRSWVKLVEPHMAVDFEASGRQNQGRLGPLLIWLHMLEFVA